MGLILAPVSYAIASLLCLTLAVLVAVGWRNRLQNNLLLLASFVSAFWAAQLAYHAVTGEFSAERLLIIEVARDAAWLLFLVAVLGKSGKDVLSLSLRYGAYLVPVVVIVLGFVPIGSFGTPESVFVPGSIVMCLIGLALAERIYGGSEPAVRRPIVYLCLAMLGIFGYDLFMYSAAVLAGEINGGLWIARGMANALIVPLLAVAARRNRDWPVDMFVSRQAAYFGIMFFGTGIYLFLMAVGGYYVKEYGGDWGTAAAAILVFGAVIFLVALLLSDRLRRRAKVFFSKHFFSSRFDYREEWQGLSNMLYHPDETRSLGERSIEAVARIYDSESGLLLLQQGGEGSPLKPFAAWCSELPEKLSLDPDSELVKYLESSTWIIDTRQYKFDPEFYQRVALPGWLTKTEHQKIVVPLLQETKLIGVIVLSQDLPISLTYEDTDLLKIVGRQVAGALAQQQTSDRLAEGRQFQAYSRLTAFLMHDLKNVAAQQSLVVKNAEKHKNNPKFIDDAFTTIDHSVKRMNRLIAQLAERNRKEKRIHIDISKALADVVASVSDRKPVPQADVDDCDAMVSADAERLSAIFTHVIRNAQDATSELGSVIVKLICSPSNIDIVVTDTGVGMDESFIRKNLFTPFESTKGVGGMGIGAYQVREYVRELKGSLNVESAVGVGTVVTIRLPVVNGEHDDEAGAVGPLHDK